ncbi:hypothetical protein FIU92_18045 (plasmid) [Ruegeria sp. THAF33]|nr:hypothetical protein FIU92_18045 [Ruegeria sp. THAF33]
MTEMTDPMEGASQNAPSSVDQTGSSLIVKEKNAPDQLAR